MDFAFLMYAVRNGSASKDKRLGPALGISGKLLDGLSGRN